MSELLRWRLMVRLPKIGGGHRIERVAIVTNEQGHIYHAPSWLYEPKPGRKKTTILEVMHDQFWAGRFVWCQPYDPMEADDEN